MFRKTHSPVVVHVAKFVSQFLVMIDLPLGFAVDDIEGARSHSANICRLRHQIELSNVWISNGSVDHSARSWIAKSALVAEQPSDDTFVDAHKGKIALWIEFLDSFFHTFHFLSQHEIVLALGDAISEHDHG